MPTKQELEKLREAKAKALEGEDEQEIEDVQTVEEDAEEDAEDEDSVEELAEDGEAEETKDDEEERLFTQADIDRIFSERLERAVAAELKRVDKKRREEDKQRLEENGELQELVAVQRTEIDDLSQETTQLSAELTTAKERLDRAGAALKKYAERERDGLPEAVVALLDKMDVADQLEWITEHGKELKPEGEAKSKSSELPSTPRGKRDAQIDDEQKRRKSARTW